MFENHKLLNQNILFHSNFRSLEGFLKYNGRQFMIILFKNNYLRYLHCLKFSEVMIELHESHRQKLIEQLEQLKIKQQYYEEKMISLS